MEHNSRTTKKTERQAKPLVVALLICAICILGIALFFVMKNPIDNKKEAAPTEFFESEHLLSNPTDPTLAPKVEMVLAPQKSVLKIGETVQLTLFDGASDIADGSKTDAVWETSDANVALVSPTGLVTAVGSGVAQISYTYDGNTLFAEAEVTFISLTSLSIEQKEASLTNGEVLVLDVTTEPTAPESLVYTSSNPLVAYVDGGGNILAKAKGEATITVSALNDETIADVCNIAVTAGPLQPLAPIEPARYTNKEGVFVREENTAENTATLMFTGDLLSLYAQQSVAKTADSYNFNDSFKYVKDIFAKADYVMGNLETAISYSAPYTQATVRPSVNPDIPAEEQPPQPRILPVLNAPSTYLDALRYAGFDGVATVNNHCADAGVTGVSQTIDILDEYQIAYTGTNKQEGDSPIILAKINNINVAFLAYSEFFNGKDGAFSAEQRKYMLHKYSKEKVEAHVAYAKDLGAEFIVAYTHWGNENEVHANSTQKAHAQELADAGVNFIAGSHSHCLQESEYITASDGRQVLVLYSMGNFVSSMPSQAHNDTAVFSIEIAKNNNSVSITNATYYPCKVYTNYEGANFAVVPTNIDNNTSAYSRIAQSLGSVLTPAF